MVSLPCDADRGGGCARLRSSAGDDAATLLSEGLTLAVGTALPLLEEGEADGDSDGDELDDSDEVEEEDESVDVLLGTRSVVVDG